MNRNSIPARGGFTSVPPPSPIHSYPIHADGGLIYNPLYRMANDSERLLRYANAPKERKTIRLDNCTLTYRVPVNAVGYDVIPIPYEVRWTGEQPFPLAVEATAFEEPSRSNGRHLFDLALPGRLDFKVEYLGSITAHVNPGAKQNIKPDMTDLPGVYPAFTRKPMVRSGVVESGDVIWFQFRVTNTGDTILDPEGFGGWALYPALYRKDASGEYKFHSYTYNLYIRDRHYFYPGESHDFWINFTAQGDSASFRIEPGEYRIDFRAYYRYYRDWNDWLNMWDGAWMYLAEMPISVAPKPEKAPVAPIMVTMTNGGQEDKLTRYIHTFEEFMTSFDCWQKAPETGNSLSGTLYLQVAPWTKDITVKLIGVNPVRCNTLATQIEVDNSTIKLHPKFHPGNCLVKEGKRVPVVYSQLMSDMRGNVQVSPWPERYIKEDIRRMMECGVNVCSTTAMPWLYDDFHNPKYNYNGDAMKYSLDVARKMGMKFEAWGSYPFDRSTVADIYHELTGDPTPLNTFPSDGYIAISQSDPNIAKANVALWMYQFKRWGDACAQFESGVLPFSTEDTRGWMRQDVNIRYPIGELSKQAFRSWLRHKYGSIVRLNAAWGSDYASFDFIDPEADGVVNIFGHHWEYTNPAKVFHDWDKAIADFDEWRVDLRIRNYRDSLSLIHRNVPQARMLLRTEGANAIIEGVKPSETDPHFRHIFYSQRRVAATADEMIPSKVLSFHSDYTTLPYSPEELRRITRLGVQGRIIPAWLPQFDNMRDIAVNSKYGTDYETTYNVNGPAKGAMMHVLTPVFPWFQAMIEEGGIPGILWEDFQCDGFVTETQEKELLFYKEKMEEYLATPEGREAVTKGVKPLDRTWLRKTNPKRCYRNI